MIHNLKVLCAKRGLSIRELCQQAGLCYESTFNWDKHSPSVDKLVKAAKVLNCTLDEIVFGTE